MDRVNNFVEKLNSTIDVRIRDLRLTRALAKAFSAGKIRILEDGARTTANEYYPRIKGFNIAVDEEVAVGRIGGKPVIHGVIQRSAPSGYGLDSDLTLAGGGLNVHSGANIRGYSDLGITNTVDLETANGSIDLLGPIKKQGVPLIGGAIQSARIVYLTSLYPLGALAGLTLTADRVYYVPVWISEDFSTNGIVFEITTIVAGSVQAGLFVCGSNFLPGARLLLSGKSAQSTTGVKTFSLSTSAVSGGRWYFIGFCSTSAMSIKGSNTGANLPSPRGGSSSTTNFLMASEDLTAGWSAIPSTANASSLGGTYLHIGLQAA